MSSPLHSWFGRTVPARLLASLSLFLGFHADAQVTLDFEFGHGTPVTNQYFAETGILISAVSLEINGVDPNDEAIVFDTNHQYTTSDRDLEHRDGWSGGNLPPDTEVGGVLILPENNSIENGIYTDPDDNFAGGYFSFAVAPDFSYNSFSVLIVDIEEDGEDWTFEVVGRNGLTAVIPVADFFAAENRLYDPSLESGDRFINQFPTIEVEDFGLDEIAELRIVLTETAGSIGAVTFAHLPDSGSIPEPGSALLCLFGSLTLLRRKRH